MFNLNKYSKFIATDATAFHFTNFHSKDWIFTDFLFSLEIIFRSDQTRRLLWVRFTLTERIKIRKSTTRLHGSEKKAFGVLAMIFFFAYVVLCRYTKHFQSQIYVTCYSRFFKHFLPQTYLFTNQLKSTRKNITCVRCSHFCLCELHTVKVYYSLRV